MIKIHDKDYQLWVWYALQDGTNPQNGWSLALETDSLEELYRAVARLDKDDERLITKQIELKVQAL